MELALSLAVQIGGMLIMAAVGFVLVKAGVCRSEDSKLLSQVVLYASTPCAVINSFMIDLTPQRLSGFGLSILGAAAAHAVFYLASVFSTKCLKFNEAESMSCMYANAGNLILPLVLLTLGQDMVFYCSGFLMVQTVLIWTHCRMVISGEKKADIRKILLNVNILSIGVGLILFLTGLRPPAPLQSALDGMGRTIAPLSMLIIGMLMAGMDLKKVFRIRRVYLVAFFRLIVLPLLVTALFKVTGMAGLVQGGKEILMITMLAASAPSASTVTMFSQIYGRQQYEASAINIVTVLLCILTMPFINLVYTAFM